MPNYIYNILTVDGEPNKVTEVFAAIAGVNALGTSVPITFKNIINPDRQDETIRDCYFHDHQNNYNKNRKPNDPIRFVTSWNPPLSVMQQLSKRFPDVEIRLDVTLEVPGDEQCGYVIYQNGEEVGNYSPESKYFRFKKYFDVCPEAKSDYRVLELEDGSHDYIHVDDLDSYQDYIDKGKVYPVE